MVAAACVHCANERERMAQFQTELLAIVGHDLRSPLAAILLSTEILAMASRDQSANFAVTRIASFAKRMTRIVDQLVDLTRVRMGGGIPLLKQKKRLGALVSSVIADLALVYPQSRFELVAGDDAYGAWDPDRITQVLANVLGNAVAHGLRDGLVTISITASNSSAVIAITNEVREDQISQHVLDTLFEPYRRGWDQEHVGPGLGLDLYIAREIVQAHGGTITAESSHGETTVRILLPSTDRHG
jgi:signal transduction histidine kinase